MKIINNKFKKNEFKKIIRNFAKHLYHKFLFLYHIISPYQYLLKFKRKKYSFIEIGCGSSRKKNWLGVDYRFGSGIAFDIRKPLPVPNNYYKIVYAEHVLEHFSWQDLYKVLNNVKDILQPGGEFLVSVPDLNKYINCYVNKEFDKNLITYKPAISSFESADLLNYIFYMDGEHKHMFDFNSIKYHLEKAGFRKIQRRNFDPKLDSDGRIFDSLFIRCEK